MTTPQTIEEVPHEALAVGTLVGAETNLTCRQREVLDAYRSIMKSIGRPPYLQAVADKLVVSRETVREALQVLRQKGHVLEQGYGKGRPKKNGST